MSSWPNSGSGPARRGPFGRSFSTMRGAPTRRKSERYSKGDAVARLFRNLKELYKYRVLIQNLVSRELKARYRGTVLGFLWSFFNPLLLMIIYTIVFGFILPNRSTEFGN